MLTNDIRLATQDDLDTIVSLGFDFWITTEYWAGGIPYSVESCRRLASIIIDTGVAIVSEDHGMLLMVVAPHPFNSNFIVATEIAFYIKPENRKGSRAIKMIMAAEQEAKNLGANQIAMASLTKSSPESLPALYSRMGYHPSESTFSKII